MQDIVSRLRAKKQDEGFTLIELLVVVVIIGVLVAIAVPVYLNYREGAADKSAQSDVRGAISALEQFYTSNGNAYPVANQVVDNDPVTDLTSKMTLPAIGAAGEAGSIPLSDKTTLAYVLVAATKSYKVCATNGGGSGKWYLYDSTVGGSVKAAATALAPATCS